MLADDRDAQEYDFDVAFSFAGEHRPYVEEIVRKVQADGTVRVFYDQDYTYDMWGEDGVEFFTNVFMNRARYVVMFISSEYAEKEWTRLEKRSSLSRALTQRTAYVLPVRLDSTQLDGLLPTIQYLDARRIGIDGIAEAILHKLTSGASALPPVYHGGVAKDADDLQALIAARTPGWEYVLYGSVLHLKREGLADKRRDHAIAYAPTNGRRVTEVDDVVSLAREHVGDMVLLAQQLNRVLSPEAQLAAFGAPGVAGDPERIVHLATRFMEVYARFLEIAAELRGVSAPSEFADLLERAARTTDLPIANLDKFLDSYLEAVDGVAEKLRRGEDIHLTLVATLELDDDAMDQFVREARRLYDGQ